MAALGQPAEAAEGFKRLLQIDPDNASAHVNLASCLSGMGRLDEAVTAYHQAFALDPPLALEVFINHEYGFTLVKLGRLDEAARMFERMKQSAAPVDKAKGFRSAALLQMFRGHYGAAVSELQAAIALNQTHREVVSEFRDRMYLIAAYEATSRSREARAEWAAVHRLIAASSLSPSWLWRVVRTQARSGRLNEARRELDRMHEWAGKATAASGVSRNVPDDVVYISVAEAEVALAQGRTAEALERIEAAHLHLKMPETLFTLAAAYAAAGRLDQAITRYEELLSKPPLGYEVQELWLEAHLALGQLYERQQRIADATRTYQALADRWKDADSDAVLLRNVRARLEALAGNGTPRAVPGR
jgi:tetratricopeptide (TPR) repeat protein